MPKNLLFVGGGRSGEQRKNSIKAMKDISGVLPAEEYRIFDLWWDEHGFLWKMAGENYCMCALIAGELIDLANDELLIGEDRDKSGKKIDLAWPLINGLEYGRSGVNGWLEMVGVEKIIGANSQMWWLTNDLDFLKVLINDLPIKKKIVIEVESWRNKSDYFRQRIENEIKFPISIKSDWKEERVVLVEKTWEVISGLLDQEGLSTVTVEEWCQAEKELVIGFVGRNFLPSKLCEHRSGNLRLFTEEITIERSVQNFLIKFARNFEVGEIGLLRLKYLPTGWQLDSIDFCPDMGRESIFAKMWQMSGVKYDNLIKKILL